MKIESITKSKTEGCSVGRLCKMCKLQKSSYYSNLSHKKIEENDRKIVTAIMSLPEEQRKRGTIVKMDCLKKIGIDISYKRLWRICNRHGLLSKIRKRKHPKDYYVKHKEELKEMIADNLLKRKFKCDKPLTKLCTDITYVKIAGGWLFLSVIIDLCTREIVAYSMSKKVDTYLAIESIKN